MTKRLKTRKLEFQLYDSIVTFRGLQQHIFSSEYTPSIVPDYVAADAQVEEIQIEFIIEKGAPTLASSPISYS